MLKNRVKTLPRPPQWTGQNIWGTRVSIDRGRGLFLGKFRGRDLFWKENEGRRNFLREKEDEDFFYQKKAIFESQKVIHVVGSRLFQKKNGLGTRAGTIERGAKTLFSKIIREAVSFYRKKFGTMTLFRR